MDAVLAERSVRARMKQWEELLSNPIFAIVPESWEATIEWDEPNFDPEPGDEGWEHFVQSMRLPVLLFYLEQGHQYWVPRAAVNYRLVKLEFKPN